ncbi:MAG TPA: putative porin [Steroidobacteraceae bacterium]|nr:putative porin [Steroidobacteraceae bacterium]
MQYPKNQSRLLQITTVGALVAALVAATPAPADEVSELKAAVQALQKRIEQLETQSKAVEETNDHQTDQIAQVKNNVPAWVPNFTWKGDLRYRNETIDQQYVAERNRDRIRLRTGFVAKANDTLKVEVGISTAENGDPRSSNQTLTGENTRKSIYLDLAYAEWQPAAEWRFTFGKMKYPWQRPGQSLFFDNDVNPEGLAVNYGQGMFFASTFYNQLEERATAGESTMFGGQVGLKPAVGPGQLTLAVGYFDFNSVQHRNPFYNNSSNGNTTTSLGCFPGQSPCLLNDYDIIDAFAEYGLTLAGRPLVLFADYALNDKAVNKLDTAYTAGFLYGKASNPHTWEFGYFYQHMEKDALYGQYIDSDFSGGNTDGEGHAFKLAYAFAKNWTLNTTYYLNKTNVDVPVAIAGVGPVFDRDYERLQVDLNFKF